MSQRIQKVNQLIKKHISEIIPRNVSFKSGVFVTVTKVDTSVDLRYTRIFISVFPESEERYVTETLRKESYSLQGVLNKKLHMRPLPRIDFSFDPTESEADEIEHILKEL